MAMGLGVGGTSGTVTAGQERKPKNLGEESEKESLKYSDGLSVNYG